MKVIKDLKLRFKNIFEFSVLNLPEKKTNQYDVRLLRLKAALPSIAVLTTLLLIPNVAQATIFDQFATYLGSFLSNTLLRVFATFAIIGSGLLALTGRIQWSRFFVVFFGVAIIFSAGAIVTAIENSTNIG